MEFQVVIPASMLEQFRKDMEAIGASHVRAALYAMNGVARDAQRDLKAMLPKIIDKPSPFTMRAIKYQTTPLNLDNLRDAETRVYVLDDQSAYLKYLMEGGKRLPGDIGPADDFIYVPLWKNLERIEAIKAINGGSLARRTLANLSKRAGRDGGKPAKAKGTKGEMFYGAPKIAGQQMGLDFWHRPTRLAAGAFGPARESMAPVPLIMAVEKAAYKPVLGDPWNDVVNAQAATLGDRLAKELALKIKHVASKTGGAGFGNDDYLKAQFGA